MSSGIIDTIKRVALNAFEASNPVKLLFGEVKSTNPVKIQVGEYLTLSKEFLVINGSVEVGDKVTLIRCQGGQKYVVLGTRTVLSSNTIYTGGGESTTSSGNNSSGGSSGSWQKPFKAPYVITSKFGEVRSGGRTHKGIDIVSSGSKLIYPILDGSVVDVGYDASGYGNYVIVCHQNNYWSLYAHMSTVYVQAGKRVNKSTVLGVEGSTGRSTGSHLHLEIRRGANNSGSVINPQYFLGL